MYYCTCTMRTLRPVSLARPSRTLRHGLGLTSKDALKARRCCVVRMVRGRLGPRRPSWLRADATSSSQGYSPIAATTTHHNYIQFHMNLLNTIMVKDDLTYEALFNTLLTHFTGGTTLLCYDMYIMMFKTPEYSQNTSLFVRLLFRFQHYSQCFHMINRLTRILLLCTR